MGGVVEMINLDKKRKILLLYREGYNKSEILREVSASRKTVRKYICEYEKQSECLLNADQIEL